MSFGETSELGDVAISGEMALEDWKYEADEDRRKYESLEKHAKKLLADEEADPVEKTFSIADAEVMAEVSADYQASCRGKMFARTKRGKLPIEGSERGNLAEVTHFFCEETIELTDVRDREIIEKLRGGRVISNIVVKTGGGKSTILPGHVAKMANKRVLFIVQDAVQKEILGKRLSKECKVTRNWFLDSEGYVVLMTPAEFVGRFMGSGWNDIEAFFDVIMVDEAHAPTAEMFAMRKALTTVKAPTSILMLSATQEGRDVELNLAPRYVGDILDEVLQDRGFLRSSYAADRSLLLAESDEKVRAYAALLARQGIEVHVLESSATAVMVDSVNEALSVSSPTMRFLVAHCKFGFGYNFFVSRVLSTGLKEVLVEKDGEFFFGPSLLSPFEVKQQMGRAGRGMVSGNKRGFVFLPEGTEGQEVELHSSEVFEAFVMLTAMNMKPDAFLCDAVADELPFGLTPRVAAGLFSFGSLPTRLAVRFLDAEGRFPPDLVQRCREFASVGGLSLYGSGVQPLYHNEWPKMDIGSMLGLPSMEVKVPVKAKGDLGVVLGLICAAYEGRFKPRRSLVRHFDTPDSGPEYNNARTGVYRPTRRLPAKVRVAEEPSQALVVHSSSSSYALEVPLADQPGGKRSGMLVPLSVATDVARAEYSMSIPDVSYVERGGKSWVTISHNYSPVVLHSPGGSQAYLVDVNVWKRLIEGQPLGKLGMISLMRSLKNSDPSYFAESDAFSSWGNPWLGVLATFAQSEVVELIKATNSTAWAVLCVSKMWRRFMHGMYAAMTDSHPVATFWDKLVNKYIPGLKLEAYSTARPIAASQAFYERLYAIREGFADVMEVFEEGGVFTPGMIKQLQHALPISRLTGNELVDDLRNVDVREWSKTEKRRFASRLKNK